MARQRPDWLIRLIDAIDAHVTRYDTSDRAVSEALALGPNYISQLKGKDWRQPSFGNVVKLCEKVNVSITYIVTGAEMTQLQEEVLILLASLSEDRQRAVLGLLQNFRQEREQTQ